MHIPSLYIVVGLRSEIAVVLGWNIPNLLALILLLMLFALFPHAL